MTWVQAATVATMTAIAVQISIVRAILPRRGVPMPTYAAMR
jgi:hypothetical protein